MAYPAAPQGNIDAGKSPAQIFADTCSNCHRRPQELKRASASFLRQHYTPGPQEAAAMASYLSGIPADSHARERLERPKATVEPRTPQERTLQERTLQERTPQERAKLQQQLPPQQEHPKAQPKGKRATELAKSHAEPHATEPHATEPAPEVRVETPPPPKLEPFEE